MCLGFDMIPENLKVFKANDIEFLHVDVMDGSFMPNFAYGPDFINRLHQITDIPLDIHLMVEHIDERYIGLRSTPTIMFRCTARAPAISTNALTTCCKEAQTVYRDKPRNARQRLRRDSGLYRGRARSVCKSGLCGTEDRTAHHREGGTRKTSAARVGAGRRDRRGRREREL